MSDNYYLLLKSTTIGILLIRVNDELIILHIIVYQVCDRHLFSS